MEGLQKIGLGALFWIILTFCVPTLTVGLPLPGYGPAIGNVDTEALKLLIYNDIPIYHYSGHVRSTP